MNLDILKVIVVLVALIYFNCKVGPKINPKNAWLINAGLSLLLFAGLLDFTDGFNSLNYLPIFGQRSAFHDLLEDQFADTSGLALFALGVFREMKGV